MASPEVRDAWGDRDALDSAETVASPNLTYTISGCDALDFSKTVASPNLASNILSTDALVSAESLASPNFLLIKKTGSMATGGGKFQWAIALVSGESLAYRGSAASPGATHL